MDMLIWAGALVSLAGLAGIVWCIVALVRARRAGLDDASLRKRMAPIVTANLASLFVSVLGLMLVVVGVLLS